MTKDEINHQAYTDVLEGNGVTMESERYRYYYGLWYPLGLDCQRDVEYADDSYF